VHVAAGKLVIDHVIQAVPGLELSSPHRGHFPRRGMINACMLMHRRHWFWAEHVVTNRLPGPPVSNDTALVTLLENNVLVGIGTADAALAAQTRFDLAWVSSSGRFRFI
jgi:hypothetical protein